MQKIHSRNIFSLLLIKNDEKIETVSIENLCDLFSIIYHCLSSFRIIITDKAINSQLIVVAEYSILNENR